LTDTKDEIESKIRVAVTDAHNSVSYDPANRPGVSNLVEIVYNLNPPGAESIEQLVEQDFATLSLKAFKQLVVDSVDSHLAPIRDRLQTILNSNEGREIDEAADIGAQKATESARATMKLVRDAVGF